MWDLLILIFFFKSSSVIFFFSYPDLYFKNCSEIFISIWIISPTLILMFWWINYPLCFILRNPWMYMYVIVSIYLHGFTCILNLTHLFWIYCRILYVSWMQSIIISKSQGVSCLQGKISKEVQVSTRVVHEKGATYKKYIAKTKGYS